MLDRRTAIVSGAMAAALAGLPGVGFAAAPTGSRKRMLLVMLRGAADGLAIAAPIGDPGFAAARGAWAEEYKNAQRLDAMFSLHPALAGFGKLYASGEALVAHALATSYRERSHFDAQNLLETGGLRAFERDDGFLNRFLALLPRGDVPALALTPALPLALRGAIPAASYAPSALPDASEGLQARIAGLYAGDAELARLWRTALEVRAAAGEAAGGKTTDWGSLGTLAAQMMNEPQRAGLVMIDLPGWDSHAGQQRQLAGALARLDALLGAFHEGSGELWADTMVAVVTEFGRTVAVNGTNGTDHGTGGAALLLGGAVRGGRVVADWPGLAPSQLHEGRDLRPTASLEAFLSGAMADHFTLDPARVFAAMFPGRGVAAMAGLVA